MLLSDNELTAHVGLVERKKVSYKDAYLQSKIYPSSKIMSWYSLYQMILAKMHSLLKKQKKAKIHSLLRKEKKKKSITLQSELEVNRM